MHKNGFFITFEGGEGSGKTTQINYLSKILTQKNRHVLTTREPGGTAEGEKIRALLVQREGGGWSPEAETMLLFAARIMHVQKLIRPALEEGKIVISDRFTDSTRAYQGYGHGTSLENIELLNRFALNGFEPDLTFILDIDPEIGLKRSGRRLAAEELHVNQLEDRYEALDISFHQRLRQGFLEIAEQNPGRCIVIDAARPQDKIADELQKIVLERLS